MDKWRRDNSAPMPVVVELRVGDTLFGSLMVQRGKSLREIVNGAELFLEIDTTELGTVLIAKSGISSVRLLTMPTADQLETANRKIEGGEPHIVLGVSADADIEQIRSAFVKLQMLYHPDRYPVENTPPEIVAYANAMIRRVNAAYSVMSRRTEAPVQVRQPPKTPQAPPRASAAAR
jgi:hypothetical protein